MYFYDIVILINFSDISIQKCWCQCSNYTLIMVLLNLYIEKLEIPLEIQDVTNVTDNKGTNIDEFIVKSIKLNPTIST